MPIEIITAFGWNSRQNHKHVGVDLLVDDPLLALVIKAEIARLRPRRQMVDPVELRVLELQQVLFLDQIAIARIDDGDLRALTFQIRNEVSSQKSGAAGDQHFHKSYSDKSTARPSRWERAAASINAC